MFRSDTTSLAVASSIALSVLLCTAGCGSNRPKLVPVKGTVTVDGKPIEGALVTFLPQFAGQPAIGTTIADGTFTLTTHPHGQGAMPGKHIITVSKVEVTGFLADKDGLSGGVAPEGVQQRWIVPKPYSDQKTSKLSAEVTGGMDPVTLALDSKRAEEVQAEEGQAQGGQAHEPGLN